MDLKCRFYKELFFAEDTGYTVALYRPTSPLLSPSGKDLGYVKVTGSHLPETKGVTYCFTGEWAKDSKGGSGKYVFHADTFSEERPEDSAGIVKYLQTIDGIGKKAALRIYAEFGDDVFRVMDEEIERLLSVKGIRKRSYEKIRACWLKKSKGKELFAYLYGFGIADAAITKVYETYEEFALDIVKSEPYSLMDFYGIGFRASDAIARDNGIALAGKQRITAAMYEALRDIESTGSTCCTWPVLFKKTVNLLRARLTEEEHIRYLQEVDQLSEKAPFEVILFKLAQREAEKGVNIACVNSGGENFYFRRLTYSREKDIARHVKRLAGYPSAVNVSEERLTSILDDAITEGVLTARLSGKQKEAVLMALNNSFSIITGGPGTGKTFVQKALLYAAERLGIEKPLLLAPTGRAARRMSESTGYPAQTIHSALGIFEATDDMTAAKAEKLECDLLIVDEASMLDTVVAAIMFSSIGRNTKVVLVGDDKQLPSVGAGAVLRELLKSGVLPTTTLKSVFRQAKGSSISYNAARMVAGETEMLEDESFSFVEVTGTENIEKEVRTQYEAFTSEYDISDVAVLSPYRRSTATGVDALNKSLQKVIFPEREGEGFQEGDKVMFTRNQSGLTNGDIGIVTSVTRDDDGRWIAADFGDQKVILDEKEAQNLELAYATTVHKSQGSEYKVVLLVMDPAHKFLHSKSIVYTALTRAKGTCVCIGSREAFTRSILNDRQTERSSMLATFLTDKPAGNLGDGSAEEKEEPEQLTLLA